ncbi:3-phenylpropionate MFS transporter [Veronia pacifica]
MRPNWQLGAISGQTSSPSGELIKTTGNLSASCHTFLNDHQWWMWVLIRPSPAVWLSLYFCGFYFVFGIYVPFWAVWMDWLGLSADDIGLIIGIGVATRCVVNLMILPKFHQKAMLLPLLRVLSVGSMIFGILHLFAGSGWLGLLLLSIAINATLGPSFPVSDTIASHYGRQRLLDYGKVRLFGSAAFIAGTTAAGVFAEHLGVKVIVPMAVCALAITACWVFISPSRLLGDDDKDSCERAGIRTILSDPDVLRLTLILSLIHGSHATYYSFSAIHWGNAGFSESTVSYLWSIGVGVEIVIFALSQRLFRHWTVTSLLRFATAVVIARWLITGLSVDMGWLLAAQAMHGVTFGVSHLAAMRFIRLQASEKILALQALYSAVPLGAALAVLIMLSGPLYTAFAGQAFLFMAGLGTLAGLLLFVRIREPSAHLSGKRESD